MWKPVMKHIVYYGPFKDSLLVNMTQHGLQGIYRSDLPLAPEGILQQKAAIDAMRRFPDYDGYLFRQDDFHLDIKAMSSWNLSSIWMSNGYKLDPVSGEAWWPNPKYGYNAALKVLNHSDSIRDTIFKNTGDKNMWWQGYFRCDFFYIPRIAVPSFVAIVGYFSEQEMNIEIAIPTYMMCFTKNFTVEAKKMYWHHKEHKIVDLYSKVEALKAPMLHHIKLSWGREAIRYIEYFMYGRNLIIKKCA
jgi:hypothetical protein